jgi:glutamate--cysteine ligase
MVRKFRVSLALAAVATALFADSPFTEGKPTDTSATARTSGPTPTRIAPACSTSCSTRASAIERYVDYLLDVPMYFSYRDGVYHDLASGNRFRTFHAR